jgi:hypothetical protein
MQLVVTSVFPPNLERTCPIRPNISRRSIIISSKYPSRFETTRPYVKYRPNWSRIKGVIALTTSTNQMPTHLINMRGILLAVELDRDNVTTRPYVKFRPNQSRIKGVIAFTTSTNQIPVHLINMKAIYLLNSC